MESTQIKKMQLLFIRCNQAADNHVKLANRITFLREGFSDNEIDNMCEYKLKSIGVMPEESQSIKDLNSETLFSLNFSLYTGQILCYEIEIVI